MAQTAVLDIAEQLKGFSLEELAPVEDVIRQKRLAGWRENGDETGARALALRRLCAMNLPAADWEQMEDEIIASGCK